MQGFKRIVFLTVAVFLFASFRANAAQDPGTSLPDDKKGTRYKLSMLRHRAAPEANTTQMVE